MIAIRKADYYDAEWMYRELSEFASWTGGKHKLFPEDPEVARAIIRNVIENHVAFIACDHATQCGLIAGYMTVHPFNPKLRLLAEAWWWVTPEYRGSSAALRLLNAWVEFGNKNADLLTFALEEESPVNPTVLTRRGFRRREVGYLLEV
jgi:RimJ/RimL family protein N-acetyltransferase